jgi:hypothetical protein
MSARRRAYERSNTSSIQKLVKHYNGSRHVTLHIQARACVLVLVLRFSGLHRALHPEAEARFELDEDAQGFSRRSSQAERRPSTGTAAPSCWLRPKYRTDRSPVEGGGLVKRGQEGPLEGDTRSVRRGCAAPRGTCRPKRPSQAAGRMGVGFQVTVGAWAQYHALWGGPCAGASFAGLDRPRGPCQVLQKGVHPTGGRQGCQHPPAASTPRAGEDIQRERPAQQSRPIHMTSRRQRAPMRW